MKLFLNNAILKEPPKKENSGRFIAVTGFELKNLLQNRNFLFVRNTGTFYLVLTVNKSLNNYFKKQITKQSIYFKQLTILKIVFFTDFRRKISELEARTSGASYGCDSLESAYLKKSCLM